LDSLSREGLENLLIGLWKGLGLTMALSTHSVEEAVLLGDLIVVLGGSPTSVVASFENPLAGLPAAAGLPEAFRLRERVRGALREGAGGLP
jgi:ABC-type nitrate/sulfonate/bicarbonate transport system ATPase subunit